MNRYSSQVFELHISSILNLIASSYYKPISNYHTYVFHIETLEFGTVCMPPVCRLYVPCISPVCPRALVIMKRRVKMTDNNSSNCLLYTLLAAQQKLIAIFEEMEHIIHNFTTITTYLMISYNSIQQLLYIM